MCVCASESGWICVFSVAKPRGEFGRGWVFLKEGRVGSGPYCWVDEEGGVQQTWKRDKWSAVYVNSLQMHTHTTYMCVCVHCICEAKQNNIVRAIIFFFCFLFEMFVDYIMSASNSTNQNQQTLTTIRKYAIHGMRHLAYNKILNRENFI